MPVKQLKMKQQNKKNVLVALGASLLEHLLTDKGTIRAGKETTRTGEKV